jgi:uncharacterized protein (TIGR02466 family)
MKIVPIFPQAVLGLTQLEVDFNKVLQHIENIEFNLTAASIGDEANAYISKNFNIFEELPFLKDKIYIHVKHYLNEIMKLKMNFQFTTSWVTRTPPNGFCQKHAHHNSFLSGVYYPVGNKNFNIKFYKRSSFWGIQNNETNTLNAEDCNVSITENNFLILFPSHLKHSIEKNLSNKTRYSIAFNTLPLDEIGQGDSKVYFK